MKENDKLKLLLLESNLEDTIEIEELDRKIRDSISSAKYRSQIHTDSRIGVRSDRLLDDLNWAMPNLLMISGKTEGGSLCYQRTDRSEEIKISPQTMSRVLNLCEQLKLVFFAGQDTAELARMVVAPPDGSASTIDCCIGIEGPISGESLRAFAGHFFSALLFGYSISKAFTQGELGIELHRKSTDQKPKVCMFCREGLDPQQQIYFQDEKRKEIDPYIMAEGIRPYSERLVRRSREKEILGFRKQIFESEDRKCLIIGGMSGSGKSELARFLAQNHGKMKKLEYYLDETIAGDKKKQFISLLGLTNYVGFSSGYEKADVSLAWKNQIMNDFLAEESPLILLHGLLGQHKPLLDLLLKSGAQVIATTNEPASSFTGYAYLNLEEENEKDEEFLLSMFCSYFSGDIADQQWLKLKYREEICRLVTDKLGRNLLMIITFARLLKLHGTKYFGELLEELLECDLASALEKDGVKVKTEKDGNTSAGEPYEILKRLFLSSAPESLSEDEKQVLRLLMLTPGSWLEEEEVRTLLGDFGLKNTRILRALLHLESCHLIVRKQQFRRLKRKKKNQHPEREQISLTPLLSSAIHVSEKGESLYVEDADAAFYQLLSKNGVYLGRFQRQLKQQLLLREQADFTQVKQLLMEATETGSFEVGSRLFPYDTLFKAGRKDRNTMDFKKMRSYFPYGCCFALLEDKDQIEIVVKPLDPDKKEFSLAVWGKKNHYAANVLPKDPEQKTHYGNARLMAWFYGKKEKNVDLNHLCFPDRVAGCPITETSIRFSDGVNRKSCKGVICLPKHLETLGAHSFGGFLMTEVQIGSKLKVIQGRAFQGCKRLVRVAGLPGTKKFGLLEIEKEAFENCSSLTDIDLNQGLLRIGDAAFKGCASLLRVSIPDTVTIIRKEAFAMCTSLQYFSCPHLAVRGKNILKGAENHEIIIT